jgi:hypothetical protein
MEKKIPVLDTDLSILSVHWNAVPKYSSDAKIQNTTLSKSKY